MALQPFSWKLFFWQLMLVVLGGMILCHVMWFNRFPILYADTGTYIWSGFEARVPNDRPVFYGLFLRHVSMAASLYFVVMMQGILTAYLLRRLLELSITGRKADMAFLVLVGFLTLFTGVSWHVSILIPDIFTAIGFLSLVLLLFHPGLRKAEWPLLTFILVMSVSFHLSNIPILGGVGLVMGAVWLWARIKRRKAPVSFARLLVAGLAIVLTFAAIPFVNKGLGGKRTWVEGAHVFKMNHYLDIGVAQRYLDKYCGKRDWEFCRYKDSIGFNFMWAPESPLYAMGGWEATEPEFNQIFKEINRDPELLLLKWRHNAEFSVKQFMQVDVEPPMPFDNYFAPAVDVPKRFPDSESEMRASRQCYGLLDPKQHNQRTVWIAHVSLMLLLLLVLLPPLRKRLPPHLMWLTLLTLVLLMVNAYVCGNLSNPLPRYQSRVVWLAVLNAVLAMYALLKGTVLADKVRGLLKSSTPTA